MTAIYVVMAVFTSSLTDECDSKAFAIVGLTTIIVGLITIVTYECGRNRKVNK